MLITSASKLKVIKRITLHIILVILASNAIGQSMVHGINLSNKNDSIWMVEEYYPSILLNPNKPSQSYDFSKVGASCASLLKIQKEESSIIARLGDTTKEGYLVEKNGYQVAEEPELLAFFKQYGKAVMRNVSPQALVKFPLVEEEYTIEQSWEVSLTDLIGDNLVKYDSLVCTVSIAKTITVSGRKEYNFRFGPRLGIAVKSVDQISLEQLTAYRSKKTIQLPLHYLDVKEVKTSKETIEIFNSYRGVLLAKADMDGDEVRRVRIFEEVLGRSRYRPCNLKDEEFQLYPNPSYGKVNVLLNSTYLGDYQFTLYNVIGKELYTRSLNHEEMLSKFTIQIPNPRKGTYLYSIIDPAGTRLFTRRLIIVDL